MAKKTETKSASKTNTSEFVLRNPEARRSTKQAIAILLIADGLSHSLPYVILDFRLGISNVLVLILMSIDDSIRLVICSSIASII